MDTVRLTLDDIETRANRSDLTVMGGTCSDVPDGCETILLLGPREPDFWPAFTASPEYKDGQPDPMDRWSLRVVTALAKDLGGQPFFPFGGPPYQPFLKWARDSGRAHVSPVGLLVHDSAGMWVSFRGAIGFSYAISMPKPGPKPCDTCIDTPCVTACPVGAFETGSYDVDGCKADLDRPENDCMARGCAVRRACPVGKDFPRRDAQSAFHMRAFR